jgi:hypothetical protein
MRIWSIHPKYLDSKGLVALWREALLAQKVLNGKTKGYKNHPQLLRFKEQSSPLKYIGSYLYFVYVEANNRGYNFDLKKINYMPTKKSLKKMVVTRGQVNFEFDHLKRKLKKRSPASIRNLSKNNKINVHPLFQIKSGNIAIWEVV